MSFHPTLQTTLTINGRDYRVCEHPSVPGQPHGLNGREATVFRIAAGDRAYALKVFKRAYRRPDIAVVGQRLRPLSGVSGLEVARRIVLDPVEHGRIIELHPDLLYAVVMPWI